MRLAAPDLLKLRPEGGPKQHGQPCHPIERQVEQFARAWIDPTSRELLDLMVDSVRLMPVLLVLTFRLEFQHAWSGQPHVTVLAPNRLGERDVAVLVRGLAGNTPLGSEVVDEIVERTDGVPLFVEELTRAVLERADQDNRIATVLSASPLPPWRCPRPYMPR